jgi:hypothetical protein
MEQEDIISEISKPDTKRQILYVLTYLSKLKENGAHRRRESNSGHWRLRRGEVSLDSGYQNIVRRRISSDVL